MYALSKRLTDAFSRRFARTVRETYREDEAYASTPWAAWPFGRSSPCSSSSLSSSAPTPCTWPPWWGSGPSPPWASTSWWAGRGRSPWATPPSWGWGPTPQATWQAPSPPWASSWEGGIAALLGLLLGLPSLRIKGVYLAIATLAFQFLADYAFKTWEAVTGGIRGRTLPPPELLGLVLDTPEKLWYLVLLFALPLFFYGKRLLMTRAGRAFMAVRDNDLSARVAGVELARVKLFAFALSAFYAGVAGGLLAQLYKAVTPEYFPLSVSIQYLAMVIVGGAGTVLGAILGAFFVLLIPEVLNGLVGSLGPQYAATLAAWRNVVFGLLILVFLILEPLGLVGLWGRVRNYFRTWPLPY